MCNTASGSAASAGTGAGLIDITHEEAEAAAKDLAILAERLKCVVKGGYGSPYGIEHYSELLGDVLFTDGDLKGITNGLQAAIKIVTDNFMEASRVAEECSNGLRKMSETIKNAG